MIGFSDRELIDGKPRCVGLRFVRPLACRDPRSGVARDVGRRPPWISSPTTLNGRGECTLPRVPSISMTGRSSIHRSRLLAHPVVAGGLSVLRPAGSCVRTEIERRLASLARHAGGSLGSVGPDVARSTGSSRGRSRRVPTPNGRRPSRATRGAGATDFHLDLRALADLRRAGLPPELDAKVGRLLDAGIVEWTREADEATAASDLRRAALAWRAVLRRRRRRSPCLARDEGERSIEPSPRHRRGRRRGSCRPGRSPTRFGWCCAIT